MSLMFFTSALKDHKDITVERTVEYQRRKEKKRRNRKIKEEK